MTPAGGLEIREPPLPLPAPTAELLTSFYNEPHNSALIRNTIHFTPEDVQDVWREILAEPGRSFLLYRDGVVVGDAAFRNIAAGGGELGLLIGPRELQGKGLGRRFLGMLLSLGFGELALERVYASIVKENTASLRLFARAGFVVDESEEGRAHAEGPDEVCMVLPAPQFRAT